MALGARIPTGARFMTVSGAETPTIRFGIFELDRRRGELRRNGVQVKLQEQPFQILLTLLEHPGEVVTREELRSRLWAEDTYVDFDHSLNAAVRRLRDALGDSAENPRFVETVARRGYRFLAPVHANGHALAVPQQAPVVSYRWWIFGTVGMALLIVGVVAGWHAGHATAPPKVLRERRLTANAPENRVTDGVISPDGKYLAFADARGFFLRQIDTGETHSVPLPKDFQPKPSAWFPDGVHMLVTWVAGPQETTSIWSISVLGGTPRKLVDNGFAPAISPDGSQVVFLAGKMESTLAFLMKADGTGVHTIIPDDKLTFLGPPAWSPDGNHLMYARGWYTPSYARIESRIEVLELKTRRAQVVLSKTGLGSTVAWTPDNRLIYTQQESIISPDDANLWITKLDSEGRVRGTASRLTHGAGFACMPSITADGKRVAYFRQSIEPDVYVADVMANGAKLGNQRQLTFDERSDTPYAWTPDNQSVIFVSNRNGNYNIFKQNVNDTEPEILVSGSEDVAIPRLTPDGKSFLYALLPKPGDTSTDVRLMKMTMGGGPPQTVLVLPEATNHQCARLPSMVCVISRIKSGREVFHYFDVDKGLGAEIKSAEVESTSSFDFNWTLSPDGTILAMARKEGGKDESLIILLSLQDGSKRTLPVPGDWLGIGSIDWAADGQSIWALAFAANGPQRLLNVGTSGQIRTVLEENRMKLGWAIPSPDGKHLAIWKANGGSNVWMLENF